MIPDPAGQYWSPYLSMGNNWISGVDPDGTYRTKFGAWINMMLFGGSYIYYSERMKEYGVGYGRINGEEVICGIRFEGPKFYANTKLRIDYGLQGGIAFKALGANFSLYGGYETRPVAELELGNDAPHVYDITQDKGHYVDPLINNEIEIGFGVVSVNQTYELGDRNKLISVGPLKSKSISAPIIGGFGRTYRGLNERKLESIQRNWSIGGRAAAILGIHFNAEIGYIFNFDYK